jgi:YfiR/HmsC-like
MSVRRPSGVMRRRSGAALQLLLLVLCFRPLPGVAQQQVYSADDIKAAFLYRFTSYVQWPPSAVDDGTFIIAVRCGGRIADALQGLVRGRQIHGEPIQVRQLSSLNDLQGARVLYVGPGCLPAGREQAYERASMPVLIVTDEPDGLRWPAVINFVTVDEHVRFEVSLRMARRLHLAISSDLLSVALRVIGARSPRLACPWSRRSPGSACLKFLAMR